MFEMNLVSLMASIPYDLFTFGPWQIYGDLKVHSFGLMVATGLLLTFTLSSKRGEAKLGISGEQFQNFGIFLVATGWVISHVFNVLAYEPEKVMEDPLILFKVWGSISSYGGLIGGILGFKFYMWRHPELDTRKMLDQAVYALTFPWFFGRVGCATVHDHPGAETDFFLGVEWTDGVTRFDLGFMEAIWWGVIVLVVLYVDRKPRPNFYLTGLVAMLYAPVRFSLDFLRVPVELGGDARYFGLTPAQYLSVLLFGAGVYFFTRSLKGEPIEWVEYNPEAEREAEEAEVKEEEKAKKAKSKHKPKKKKKS